ncbi:restriction endonuclease subunit S [Streptococcus parasanguinis]|uniref:DNA specificity domain-containing restriction modification system protein n=1 Tax=Streptococcus parasanguinis FW213 TaxID=1114965 RepID=I1ZKS3_STRPA|nr:restriction endonuclease subunit S [Streptococcus parasanguinis]AFJ25647.1 DNA specificity domain-containing restriction modification system protein [Streptococcus parasanguinis FW213]KJU99160.1 type I restriction-modification system, specificity protein [Streptococcus parasanguinis]
MSEWKRYKLGELLRVKHGWAFKGEFFSDTGVQSILTPGNFYESGGFKANPSKDRFYSGDYPKEYLCSKGDLVVAMTEQAAGLLGSTAIVPEDNRYLHNQRIGLISCNESLNKDFAYYLFMTQSVRQQISRSASGTKVKHTSPEKIYDVQVDIPKIQTQKNIAIFLSLLDKKIQINNQINQELEAMAKTLYDYWFVQFDFPDQNGKPYKSSGGKMVYNPELKREIPEGWGVEKLDDLGTVVGGSTPTKSISDNFTKGGEGYSWITPNDLSNNKGNKFIKNGEIDVTVKGLKDASLKLYPEGTVLMSSRAPVGYLAIATKELTTNQGFKSFIPDKKYGKNYIYYTLQNCLKVIEQNASGSTFKEISATVLKDIKVLQPNLEIVKKFEITVSSINNYIRDNEVQNQELTQLRDWLLPMLMNGQVKVE